MVTYELDITFALRNVILNYPIGDALRAVVCLENKSNRAIHTVLTTKTLPLAPNIHFDEKLPLKYNFHNTFHFKVIYYVVNSSTQQDVAIYAEFEFSSDELVARGGIIETRTPSNAIVEIRAIVPELYSQYIHMQFIGSHIHSPQNLPLSLYYILSIPTENRTVMLHKSEIIKDNKNPNWKPFVVPFFLLNFYNDKLMKIECYNTVGNHPDVLVGSCYTTLAKCQGGPGALNTYMLLDSEGKRGSEKTSIELRDFQLQPEQGPTIFKMFENKMRLDLSVAVDLTASNGNPTMESSLHFIHPYRVSPYSEAILKLSSALVPYVSPSGVPSIGALGFGANVNTDGGVGVSLSQCFYLNGSSTNDRVDGIPMLLNAYKTATMAVQPYAPTDFSEVIYHVSKWAKAETRLKMGKYFVLIIFSDGGPSVVTKYKRTVDAIVDTSIHPLSIIAVGVGNDRDFGPMRSLESLALKHSDGRLLARQNYSFVETSTLQTSDVLSMISLQMVQWKTSFSQNSHE